MPLLLNTDQNSLVRLYTPFPEVGVEVRQVNMLTHLDCSENPLSSKKTFCKRLSLLRQVQLNGFTRLPWLCVHSRLQ